LSQKKPRGIARFFYQFVEKALHGFFNRRLAKTSFGQPLEMTAVFPRPFRRRVHATLTSPFFNGLVCPLLAATFLSCTLLWQVRRLTSPLKNGLLCGTGTMVAKAREGFLNGL